MPDIVNIGTGENSGDGDSFRASFEKINNNSRIKLTANLDLYVATTGSDSNDGLTVGAPFLTIQKAVEVACRDYDMNGNNIQINVADGTYAENVNLLTPVGDGILRIYGNTVTPANVVIDPASGRPFEKTTIDQFAGGVYDIRGFKLIATGAQAIWLRAGLVEMRDIDFGVAANHVIVDRPGAMLRFIGPYTVSGSADSHLWASHGGVIQMEGAFTITFTGSPAWAAFGWYAFKNGLIDNSATITNSGTVTGTRYRVESNALAAGVAQAPGSVAGTTATSGVVI